ncbi:hypothetical protein [Streptococcus suis]|uniref:hypothetical protein n=1 Tax=Streptococcus suis TaxID=1307 RepID=UPI00041567C9|nr:hypothetical protein [Streptococcus suis]
MDLKDTKYITDKLFQLEQLVLDIYAELERQNPQFAPISWYVYHLGLDDEQASDIMQYFLFQQDKPLEELTVWLEEWVATNRYPYPRDFIEKMARRYYEEVTRAVDRSDASLSLEDLEQLKASGAFDGLDEFEE